ncbi:MAG: hypothetical protein ACOYLL_01865 [Beijerinckiaceae bacterium]
MGQTGFDVQLSAWRKIYVTANRGTLDWMLDRPALRGVFLNTKMNHITGRDFTAADGWKGPQTVLGWIQGRGLEALVTHASFFDREDASFAKRLDEAGKRLFDALSQLYARTGKGFFAYDEALNPVYPDAGGQLHAQALDADLSTFSDIFIVKGLLAASLRYDRAQVPTYLKALNKIIADIEAKCFVSNERQRLGAEAVAKEPGDYGPRMIMIGGASMLKRFGLGAETGFGTRFIGHILDTHQATSAAIAAPVLLDLPGQPVCNPGHALEFSGFGLEFLGAQADAGTLASLQSLIKNHFALGFSPPGIRLKVDSVTGESLSPYFPWWSVAETIRAAALGFEQGHDAALLAIWQQSHEAFFNGYWRTNPAIAYQTKTVDGPVDFVPSTPDLDPGYHTGMSLLTAIEAIDRIFNSSKG